MLVLKDQPKGCKNEELAKNLRKIQNLSRRDTLTLPLFRWLWMPSRIQNKRQIKNFKYEGISTDTLFGQHLFPSTGKRIVITEGELDAASCYEAMENWPMVSLPHGAASAKKDLQKQIPLLQGYEEIVLFFDNDDAGRRAVEQAATILRWASQDCETGAIQRCVRCAPSK